MTIKYTAGCYKHAFNLSSDVCFNNFENMEREYFRVFAIEEEEKIYLRITKQECDLTIRQNCINKRRERLYK